MHTWWDHGKGEGIDVDTIPVLHEWYRARIPMKFCIVEKELDNAKEGRAGVRLGDALINGGLNEPE